MENTRIYIGELSKRANVPVKTIRYYEDMGLLKKPPRTESGYRVYAPGDVEKLLFIKTAKDLGLKLSEIRRIICGAQKGLKPCCRLVHDLFTKKIGEYEEKIAELDRTRKRLKEKLNQWVKPAQAKNMEYVVCPQIEMNGRPLQGRGRNLTAAGIGRA